MGGIIIYKHCRFHQLVRTFTDVPTSVLYGRVSVDVGQEAQTEPVGVIRGVGEPVHYDAGLGRMERLPHTIVQLIVYDGTPVLRFLVCYRLQVH